MPSVNSHACRAVVALLLSVGGGSVWAADWPTFRHDNRRTSHTTENIAVTSLRQAWTHKPIQPPQPAWPGPARWDAYVKRKILSSMRDYDVAYHVIAVGDRVYYSSSADDAVHCLDAASGEEQWRYTTGGPVRIVPTWWQQKIYFGSDDGYAYCLDADDGSLVWRHRAAPSAKRTINDGRLISLWPCRTGVLVESGTAYFGASLLPWRESYLCAVDAETGRVEGAGRYVRAADRLTLEGPLLASQNRLIGTQGRSVPYLFNRASGRGLMQLGHTGGSFALLAPDDRVYVGPGSKEGRIGEADPAKKTAMVKCGGIAMALDGDVAYVLERYAIGALRLKDSIWEWRTNGVYPHAILLAGDKVLVGGDGRVAALRADDGKLIWEEEIEGKAEGLVVAGRALYVSTDLGAIHCLRPGEEPPEEEAPPATTLAKAADKLGPPRGQLPAPFTSENPEEPVLPEVPAYLTDGPVLEFSGPKTAVVRWRTRTPTSTVVDYEIEEHSGRFEDATPKTEHEAVLSGLWANRVYTYAITSQLDGRELVSPRFQCDTYFNYSLPARPEHTAPYATDELTGAYERAAEQMLARLEGDKGICLVLGSDLGRLAYELAMRSELHVVGLETDAAKVDEARRRLQATGIYGSRVRVLHVDSLDELPLPDHFANLVVCDGMLARGACVGDAGEVQRVLRPLGGLAVMGQPAGVAHRLERAKLQAWLAEADVAAQIVDDEQGLWAIVDCDPLPGAGEWSHQYGRADNATYAGEELAGARTTGDLEVQWVGRPGPRHQSDRQNRKAAPLSTGGRLFVQGLERIIALDAYNGTILWNLEIPGFRRFNIRNDSANWCADERNVFAVVGSQCWQIDAASGRISARHSVASGLRETWDYDWGYVGSYGDLLFGSSIQRGATYREFWGGQYWYTHTGGALAQNVCSDSIFALDKQSGRRQWQYHDGVIINTTISIADDRVWFVESRNEQVKAADSGRIGLPELWKDQFLVALDCKTGKKLWQQPIDTDDGTNMFSMAYGAGKLVIVSSVAGHLHVATFDGATGAAGWETRLDWLGDGKGAHSSRPVIIGKRLYIRPAVFEMESGKRLPIRWVGGTCGTYAAAKDAFLFRGGNSAMWCPSTKQQTSWSRLRPDCWLSTIPAAGLVLSPEGGGGCSCGSWLETSIAFAPRKYPSPLILPEKKAFMDAVAVEITSHNRAGTIHYTLDGTLPTELSPRYEQPIRLTETTTVRARTFWPSARGDKPVASETVTARFDRQRPDASLRRVPVDDGGTAIVLRRQAARP